MIYGQFGAIGELIFAIDLIAVDGERLTVDVLLDTGFTTGYLAIDIQDAENLGWSVITRSVTMRTARGLDYFDIYEGRVFLDDQEYIIPVLAGTEVTETLLGRQWLKTLPLTVNFPADILTLG
jgi:predicted aspartyl protease